MNIFSTLHVGRTDQKRILMYQWETSSLFCDSPHRSLVCSFTHPSFMVAEGPLCALHRTRRQYSQDPVISKPQGSCLVETHSLDFRQSPTDDKRKSNRGKHSTEDRGTEVNMRIGS